MIVSGIVRAALRRAGVENPPTHGANLLRHSVATMMLRGVPRWTRWEPF
jgi:hypothetical protein